MKIKNIYVPFLLIFVSFCITSSSDNIKRIKTYERIHFPFKGIIGYIDETDEVYDNPNKNYKDTLRDYIRILSNSEGIISGKYFGNAQNYHFEANLIFREKWMKKNNRFHPESIRFSKETISPYTQQANYIKFKNGEVFVNESDFYRIVDVKNNEIVLVFRKWYYNGRSDKLLFKLVEERKLYE